ncbi:hypothetical protein ACWCXC_17225 [Streptomyces sp. NPDC001515]
MSTTDLTRRAALRRAARVWRAGLDSMDRMPVEAAARACYVPGGPSLLELQKRIAADRAARAIPAARRAAA